MLRTLLPPPRISGGVRRLSRALTVTTVITTLFATACQFDSPDSDEGLVASQTEVLLQTVDLPLELTNGIPTFASELEFCNMRDLLDQASNEALAEWYHAKGLNTLYNVFAIEETPKEELSPITMSFLETDEVDGELIPSPNAMLAFSKLANEEGFISMRGQVGYLSRSLQVWAPLDEHQVLRDLIIRGQPMKSSYQVVYDVREEWASALNSRSNEEMEAPANPWVTTSGFATRLNTNRTDDNKNQLRTQWGVSQVMGPIPGAVYTGYSDIYGKSYKQTFGYKTVHTYRWDMLWTAVDSPNPTLKSVLSSRDDKEFTVSTILRQTFNINTFEQYVNTVAGIINVGNEIPAGATSTWHTHRGMGGEYNFMINRR